MSRATHDFECSSCRAVGKVCDDVITCPECGKSIEGQAITGEALQALIRKFAIKDLLADLPGDLGCSAEKKG